MKNKTNVWNLLGRIFLGVSVGLILLVGLFFILFRQVDYDFGVMFGEIWAGVGVLFGIFACGIFGFCKADADKKKRLIESGSYVMADIVDIDIFASEMLFGEADSDYMDMPVKVYYTGKGYKKYHVDLRDLGIYKW